MKLKHLRERHVLSMTELEALSVLTGRSSGASSRDIRREPTKEPSANSPLPSVSNLTSWSKRGAIVAKRRGNNEGSIYRRKDGYWVGQYGVETATGTEDPLHLRQAPRRSPGEAHQGHSRPGRRVHLR